MSNYFINLPQLQRFFILNFYVQGILQKLDFNLIRKLSFIHKLDIVLSKQYID